MFFTYTPKQRVGNALAECMSESESFDDNMLVRASYHDKGILTLKLHGVTLEDYEQFAEYARKEIRFFTTH